MSNCYWRIENNENHLTYLKWALQAAYCNWWRLSLTQLSIFMPHTLTHIQTHEHTHTNTHESNHVSRTLSYQKCVKKFPSIDFRVCVSIRAGGTSVSQLGCGSVCACVYMVVCVRAIWDTQASSYTHFMFACNFWHSYQFPREACENRCQWKKKQKQKQQQNDARCKCWSS